MALFDSWTTSYVSATCEKSVIFKCQCFCLFDTFSVTEIPPQRDSAKRQLLHLYSQFSLTKILKALHAGLDIYSILEERPKALLKIFLIDVDRLTLLKRPPDVIFEHIF